MRPRMSFGSHAPQTARRGGYKGHLCSIHRLTEVVAFIVCCYCQRVYWAGIISGLHGYAVGEACQPRRVVMIRCFETVVLPAVTRFRKLLVHRLKLRSCDCDFGVNVCRCIIGAFGCWQRHWPWERNAANDQQPGHRGQFFILHQ